MRDNDAWVEELIIIIGLLYKDKDGAIEFKTKCILLALQKGLISIC